MHQHKFPIGAIEHPARQFPHSVPGHSSIHQVSQGETLPSIVRKMWENFGRLGKQESVDGRQGRTYKDSYIHHDILMEPII